MMFISYAQNFEDVMLRRAFSDVVGGFYIDIGAQDPVIDSVSRSAYENGWRGVHVEPTSYYAEKLRANRPDETVLQCAIGSTGTVLHLFEFPETGLSTGDPIFAEEHRKKGFFCREIDVKMCSLESLLNKYADTDIHWLKIDVEGMENDVLASWGKSSKRPWIVVVEATIPLTNERVDSVWNHHLVDRGYELCYFDGLNTYFLHCDHESRKSAFQSPPNVFDEFSISGSASSMLATFLNGKIYVLRHEIEQLKKELDVANENSRFAERTISSLKAEEENLTKEFSEIHKRLQKTIDERNAALNAIYDSRIWKLTLPLRRALETFKKLFRNRRSRDS